MTHRWRETDSNLRFPAAKEMNPLREAVTGATKVRLQAVAYLPGTNGSNPVPSSAESGANHGAAPGAQPVEGCEVRAGHYHRVPWSCASQWIRSRLRGTLVPPIPRWRASGPLQAILAALARHLRYASQGPGDRRTGMLVLSAVARGHFH